MTVDELKAKLENVPGHLSIDCDFPDVVTGELVEVEVYSNNDGEPKYVCLHAS